MFVNQGMTAYTLALFRGQSSTEAGDADSTAPKVEPRDQALKYAIARIEALAEDRPEVGPSAAPLDPTTDEGYGQQYANPAERAQMFAQAYARQAETDAFIAKNGYKNRLSRGLYVAHGMAQSQAPGQAFYASREEAIAGAAERIGDMVTAARDANRPRDNVAMQLDPNDPSMLVYVSASASEVGITNFVARLSEDDMRINREKQAHDLKAFVMWYDVMAANLTRDFGITMEQSTRRDESGRVFLNDMEVTHPEFGKLGEIKDGRFWISGEDGALIHPEVYFGNRPA